MLCDNLEGWNGEGDGRGFRREGTYVYLWSGRSPEKEMATHSSIHAWEIPWTEEPGGLQSIRLQDSDTTSQLSQQSFLALHLLLRVPTQLTLLTKLLSFCFYFLTTSASTLPLNVCAMLLLAITTETLSNWPEIYPDIKLPTDICTSVL